MSPYRTCAASSSPFTSLSRTAAHEASLLGTIFMPYFLSNSTTDAMTTEEQSVSGIKPIFNSFFSGASEPAAHAALLTAAGTRLMIPTAPARLRKSRRLADFLRAILCSFISRSIAVRKTKKRSIARLPQMNALVPAATVIGRSLLNSYAIDVPAPLRWVIPKQKQKLESTLLRIRTQGCYPHRTVAVQQNSL